MKGRCGIDVLVVYGGSIFYKQVDAPISSCASSCAQRGHVVVIYCIRICSFLQQEQGALRRVSWVLRDLLAKPASKLAPDSHM